MKPDDMLARRLQKIGQNTLWLHAQSAQVLMQQAAHAMVLTGNRGQGQHDQGGT